MTMMNFADTREVLRLSVRVSSESARLPVTYSSISRPTILLAWHWRIP